MDAKAQYDEKPWLKFYPEGVPATVEVPERSIPDIFDEMSGKYSGRTALVFYGNKINFGKLREEIDRFATALSELGISRGDKVALYMVNSPQYVIAYFGALKLGATVTPISPVYTSIEVKHQLEDSEAESIVCQDFLFDNVERAEVSLKNVILGSIGDYLPLSKKLAGGNVLGRYGKMEVPSAQFIESRGFHQFQKLIKKYPPNPPKVEINPKEDIAALPYTGGTTGLPKGAILTHYNLLACQMQVKAFWPTFEEGKEVIHLISLGSNSPRRAASFPLHNRGDKLQREYLLRWGQARIPDKPYGLSGMTGSDTPRLALGCFIHLHQPRTWD